MILHPGLCGTGRNGFTVAGAVNSNRYSGYIDNFKVYTR